MAGLETAPRCPAVDPRTRTRCILGVHPPERRHEGIAETHRGFHPISWGGQTAEPPPTSSR